MITEQKQQVLDYYNQGLTFYKQRNWQEALNMFQKALEVDPDDGPSQIYHERCQLYLEEPPPPDWDGVFTMTTK